MSYLDRAFDIFYCNDNDIEDVHDPKNKLFKRRTTKMSNKKTEYKKITTPLFRASFPAIFEAKSFNGSKPAFEVTMLFDKEKIKKDPKEMQYWKALVAEVQAQTKAKFGDKLPATFHNPIRDGDKEKADKDGYAGCYFIKAKTFTRPGVIYSDTKTAVEEGDIFAGCVMRATVNVYAFDNIAKGVAFGLNNLMFYKGLSDKVEAFGGGRASAESDFADINDDVTSDVDNASAPDLASMLTL